MLIEDRKAILFEKAISSSDDYNEDIARLSQPEYEYSNGEDSFVNL